MRLLLVVAQLAVLAAFATSAEAAEFSVVVKAPVQSMEQPELIFTVPESGDGSVVGTVSDGADHFTAFSRRFAVTRPGEVDVPAKLNPRALAIIRETGYLRVSLRTKFTPTGSKEWQIYRSYVKLRPFALTSYGTIDSNQYVTATLRTPRTGELAVSFLLIDRATEKSEKVKVFNTLKLAGGSYSYTARLTAAARRAISVGKVRLQVTARLTTDAFSAQMLRTRFIHCRYCGVR